MIMKAVVINRYGDRNELVMTTLPKPTPAEDEVLVKLKATSINPIDWKARRGDLQKMFHWRFPVVLGWDLAGIVTAVGSKVTHFHEGDTVFARPDIDPEGTRGTYAEYMTVKADKVALKPRHLSFEEAAAVPLAGLTAWQAVHDLLHVEKGDRVLIQAGAGGVGLFAVQMARFLGAEVTTTAGPSHTELLKRLGAKQVINYHTTSITSVLHNVDAVFDTVGDLDGGLQILKGGGRLVSIIAAPTETQQKQAKLKHQFVSNWWLQTNGQQLAELGRMLATGDLKVVLDQVFPFTEDGLRQAHERSESQHATGKIVIRIA